MARTATVPKARFLLVGTHQLGARFQLGASLHSWAAGSDHDRRRREDWVRALRHRWHRPCRIPNNQSRRQGKGGVLLVSCFVLCCCRKSGLGRFVCHRSVQFKPLPHNFRTTTRSGFASHPLESDFIRLHRDSFTQSPCLPRLPLGDREQPVTGEQRLVVPIRRRLWPSP
jgi:hypothetical protein